MKGGIRRCQWCFREFVRGQRVGAFSGKCCSTKCAAAIAGFRLQRMLRRHTRTKPERTLFALVRGAYADAEQERRFGRHVVDVYVPQLHMAFEADGTYWHRDSKAKDAARDATLRERYDLTVVRLSERELSKMRF